MPVAAPRLEPRALARACVRGSPETHDRGLSPVGGDRGAGDPLEDWIREDAALAGTFSMQQPAVAVTGSGLKFIEVVQQAAAAEVVVDAVSMRSARPSFMYCLIRECL